MIIRERAQRIQLGPFVFKLNRDNDSKVVHIQQSQIPVRGHLELEKIT